MNEHKSDCNCKCSEENESKENNYEEFFGKTFGNWTILNAPIHGKKYREILFLAKCKCGRQKYISIIGLKRKSNNCSGCSKEKTIENPTELIGKIFGKWKVIGEKQKKREICVLCECKCGEKKFVAIKNLINGISKGCASCVMIKGDYLPHKLRHIWTLMKDRCKNMRYKDYAARGIKVCDRWINSFENFLEDMRERPTEEHEIDRIDVNGNYEPTNCRWVTRSENCLNKRNSKANRRVINVN